MKRLFFRHHWWLVIAGTAAGAVIIFKSSLPDKATAFAAVVAAGLSVVFFVQQQRLAEMNLFRELITAFNGRYDQLHARLMGVRENGIADYQAALDYFNLCAEEFLFFSEGYINHKVWRSWCKGMLFYLEVEPFDMMWKDLGDRDSYYGLTIEEIRKGAALNV